MHRGILLISVISLVAVWVLGFDKKDDKNLYPLGKPLNHQDCDILEENRIVNGDSLNGLINDKDEVTILFGYYKCNEIERNDIVIYRFAGNDNPVIKVVKAIPGDDFHLENGRIFVNGVILRNSFGKEYQINSRAEQLLSLYEKEHSGKIPANAYLILGNNSNGSLDSTRFGLVGKSEILGKVLSH